MRQRDPPEAAEPLHRLQLKPVVVQNLVDIVVIGLTPFGNLRTSATPVQGVSLCITPVNRPKVAGVLVHHDRVHVVSVAQFPGPKEVDQRRELRRLLHLLQDPLERLQNRAAGQHLLLDTANPRKRRFAQ